MPMLDSSFQEALNNLKDLTTKGASHLLFWHSSLDEFLALIEEINKSEPRLLRRLRFPERLDEIFKNLFTRVDEALKRDPDYDSPDEYDSEADASFSLGSALRGLEALVPTIRELARPRIKNLTLHANACRERCNEFDRDPGYDEDISDLREEHRLQPTEVFDINSVFADL
jgi:hypothetical protein